MSSITSYDTTYLFLLIYVHIVFVLSRSPGFGLVLIAETINGTFLGAEAAANPRGSKEGPSVPEDLGKLAANLLLEEVYRVRCHVDNM